MGKEGFNPFDPLSTAPIKRRGETLMGFLDRVFVEPDRRKVMDPEKIRKMIETKLAVSKSQAKRLTVMEKTCTCQHTAHQHGPYTRTCRECGCQEFRGGVR